MSISPSWWPAGVRYPGRSLTPYRPPFSGSRFRDALRLWIAARTSIGKPLAPASVAWKLQRGELVKWGEEAGADAMIHCATQGYQGLFLPSRLHLPPGSRAQDLSEEEKRGMT